VSGGSISQSQHHLLTVSSQKFSTLKTNSPKEYSCKVKDTERMEKQEVGVGTLVLAKPNATRMCLTAGDLAHASELGNCRRLSVCLDTCAVSSLQPALPMSLSRP
jgi:hypothetical protein